MKYSSKFPCQIILTDGDTIKHRYCGGMAKYGYTNLCLYSIKEEQQCEKCQGKDMEFIKKEVARCLHFHAIHKKGDQFTIDLWKQLLELTDKSFIKKAILDAAKFGDRNKEELVEIAKELKIGE